MSLQRRPSRTGMVDSPAAAQHDVRELGMNVFRQRVKFTDAVFDHVLGLPSVHLPNDFLLQLRKWEQRQGKEVVQDALCLLLCSRFGLTGVELKALLHLTEPRWIALRATLRPYLKGTTSGKVNEDRVRMRFFFEKAYNPDLQTDIYATRKHRDSIIEVDKKVKKRIQREAAEAAEEAARGNNKPREGRRLSAVQQSSVAARVAGMAAKLALRRRKLTRVYSWPPVRSELMRYYHVCLGGFFSARAAGASVDEAALSVLTGTAIIPRKVKPGEQRPGSANSTGPSARAATGRNSIDSTPSVGVQSQPAAGREAPQKSARSTDSAATWKTARRGLWAKLRSSVKASKQLRKFYRLRLKQSVMYLSTLFAERIKRKATAIPKKYRTASGTGVGIRIGRWISRGDEGVASGLRFMPYHLLQADRRKEALSVMLDLQYVEAMAASGYVYELIDCLCHLMNASKKLEQSLSAKLEELTFKHERAQARAAAGTPAPPGSPRRAATPKVGSARPGSPTAAGTPTAGAGAAGATGAAAGAGASGGGGGGGLLALVQSDAFEVLSVKAKLKRARHRLVCINEMLEFVRAEVTTLSRFPSLTFQLAASRPDSSLIGEATKQHRIRGKELRPYLRWVNKPQHRDPCVLVLQGVESPVTDLHYGPKGTVLATGTLDGHVVMWDIQTGTVRNMRQVPQFQPRGGRRRSSGGSSMGSVGEEKGEEHGGEGKSARPFTPEEEAKLEEMRKAKKERMWKEGTGPSPLEEAVAALRAKKREARRKPPEPTAVLKVRVHPKNSRYVVSADGQGRILQWDMVSGANRALAPEGMIPEAGTMPVVHTSRITALEWNSDGSLLFSGDEAGWAILWRFPEDDRGRAVWDLLHSGEDGNGVVPVQWIKWRAQEGAVMTARFGAQGWVPELEVNTSGTDPSRNHYRSPAVSALGRDGDPSLTRSSTGSGNRLSSLRMSVSDTFGPGMGMYDLFADGGYGMEATRRVAGGGLSSVAITSNNLRVQRALAASRSAPFLHAQTAPAATGGHGGAGSEDGGRPNTAGSFRSTSTAGTAATGVSYKSGTSYGSGAAGMGRRGSVDRVRALQSRKLPRGNPLHNGSLVSPVVMGNHVHSMFPHGSAHALMCSMPPRLRAKTKRALAPPKVKPTVLKGLKAGSVPTAARDAVVAKEHRPWTTLTMRGANGGVDEEDLAASLKLTLTGEAEPGALGGDAQVLTLDTSDTMVLGAGSRSGGSSRASAPLVAHSTMLRTSASMPALAEWNKSKDRMSTPGFMKATKPPMGGAAEAPLVVTDGPGAAGWDVTWASGEMPGAGDLDDLPTEEDETESLVSRVRKTATNPRLLSKFDEDVDAESLMEQEPNELGALSEGDLLVAVGGPTTLYVWRITEAGEVSKVGQTVGEVLGLRASTRGVTAVVRRTNSIVRCIATTGERVTVADPNGSEMLAVGFSPTRDRIAATMEDNSVRVYVAATGQRVGVMRGHLKKATCMAWAPDGYHLATAGESGQVRVWLPHIIAKLGPQPQHRSAVHSVDMTSYESLGKIASVSTDGEVKMWRMSDGKLFAKEMCHRAGFVTAVEFRGRGVYERCNAITTGGMRRWWPELNAPGSLPFKDMDLASNVRVWQTSPAGDLFALVNMDGLDGLQVVNTLNHKLRTNFARKEATMVRLIRFSPDCRLLFLALAAGVVQVYDLAQARHEAVGVKATTSGATSHLNTSVNAKVDRRPLTVLEDIHRQSVQDLVFGPDGRQMIWLSVESPVIKVWNVVAAIQANLDEDPMARFRVTIIQRMTGHRTLGSMNITEATWSPTGQRIASGGHDGTLRIWDINTQSALHVVRHAHDDTAVERVRWCITNERIVTSGRDRTVRVWHPERGVATCLWLLRPPAVVACLAVNTLGTRIAIGDQNGGLSLLQLEGVRVGGEVQDTHRPPSFGTRVVPRSVTVARAGGGRKEKERAEKEKAAKLAKAAEEAAAAGTDAVDAAGGTGDAGNDVPETKAGASDGSDEESEDDDEAVVNLDDSMFDSAKGAASDAMANWTSVPVVTMTRLYLNEKHLWHSKLTVPCAYCSHRFNVFLQMVKVVQDVQQKMQLEGPKETFFKDPRLVMRCLHCKQPHRLNPFVLDNPLGLK